MTTLRLLSVLPLLLGALSLPACVIELDGDIRDHLGGHCQGNAPHVERFTIDEPITAIVVDGGVGNVTVHAHAQEDVVIEASLFGERGDAEPRLDVRDGVLHVDVECDGIGCCGADLDLAVPTAVTLEVDLGVGDVVVAGLAGAVDVDVGTGDIEVVELAAGLGLHTGTGTIEGRGLRSTSAWLDVGTGDVSLSYDPAAELDALAVDVGVGAVTLRIPEGSYDLRLETGVGDASISAGLGDQAGASGRIEVDVGTGDIHVEAL